MAGGSHATVEQKFWAKVDRRSPDECWPWLGGVGNHGYGVFYPGQSRQELSHRFALSTVQPIDIKAHALHSCDNKICVNPGHLKWGTHTQNMFEAALRGRAKAGRTLPDHCPSGHRYTPHNTLVSTRKGRHGRRYTVHSCRECNRLYLARRRTLRKAHHG